MYEGGPYMGVVAAKAGYTGTPVLAAGISYTLNVNTPEGVLVLGPGAKPHNERPPPPRITHGAPIGSLCLVQFVAGVAQIFMIEWPATKVCTP